MDQLFLSYQLILLWWYLDLFFEQPAVTRPYHIYHEVNYLMNLM